MSDGVDGVGGNSVEVIGERARELNRLPVFERMFLSKKEVKRIAMVVCAYVGIMGIMAWLL